jgi:gliding motility-associated-like protein
MSQNYSVSQSGNYSAIVTLNGCSFADDINIVVNPLPTFSFSEDIQACEGDTIQLIVNIPGAEISWQDGTSGPEIRVTTSGVYMATALLDDCSYTDEVRVDFTVLPQADLGNDTTLCENQTIVLTAAGISTSFVWSTGSSNPDITINEAGVYWLEIFEGDCRARDSITVSIAPAPTVDMPLEYTLCEDSTITVVPSGMFDSFVWSEDNTTGPLQVSTGGVIVYEISLANCIGSGSISVEEVILPVIDLGSDRVICRQEELTLTASPARTDYVWQDGSSGPEYQVTGSGTYVVTLTEQGCSTSASVEVMVEECNDQILLFPNVFAPGIGGANGEFRPVKGTDVQIFDYQLNVYDRWGNLLYASNDYLEAWNGRYGNDYMNPGVYIYRATGRYSFGLQENTFDIKGDVTVVR